MWKLGTALGLTLVISACGREAGYEVDMGTFGNATLNNTQMMNGELNYATILNQRFANEVPNTINFAFDSATLDESAKQILTQQANWIRQFPEVRFRVYGHTDAVGSPSYNKNLGLRRARAVVNFFAARGLDRSRLEAMVSYGETQPVVATPDRDRRNRRTVTAVAGFIGRTPTELDGKYAEIIRREYVESATQQGTVTSDRSEGFATD